MIRKIIIIASIAVGVLIVAGLGIAVYVFLQNFMKNFASFNKIPEALKTPAVLVNSYNVTKTIYIEENQLGSINDIVIHKQKDQPGFEIGIAGDKSALFISAKNQNRTIVKFDSFITDINIIYQDKDNTYAFINRGSWAESAAFFDHTGKTVWKYGGSSSGVDDMAAGDINGDGKLEFAVGFNGGNGIHLLDSSGKKIWQQSDANVWHVEMIDVNHDNKLEIVHSNASGTIVIRDEYGNVIKRSEVDDLYLAHFSLMTLKKITGEQLEKENYLLIADDDQFVLCQPDGTNCSKYHAPYCNPHYDAKGVSITFKSDEPDYLAVLAVPMPHWKRSIVYIIDKSGTLVYQEVLSDTCNAIAVLPEEKTGTESLLLGCQDKVWKFSFVNQ